MDQEVESKQLTPVEQDLDSVAADLRRLPDGLQTAIASFFASMSRGFVERHHNLNRPDEPVRVSPQDIRFYQEQLKALSAGLDGHSMLHPRNPDPAKTIAAVIRSASGR